MLARIAGLIGRADGLIHGATNPEMREAIVEAVLVVKDARAWLNETQITRDEAGLIEIDTTLVISAEQLTGVGAQPIARKIRDERREARKQKAG